MRRAAMAEIRNAEWAGLTPPVVKVSPHAGRLGAFGQPPSAGQSPSFGQPSSFGQSPSFGQPR
jgi:hypothetical protein